MDPKLSLRSRWLLCLSQDVLMQLAKAVASAAAALVLKAKSVAQRTEDSGLQTQVIAAATQCALSTSQLVACTKVSPDLLCPVSLANSTTHSHKPLILSLTPEASSPILVTTVKTTNTPSHNLFLLPTCLKFRFPIGGSTYNQLTCLPRTAGGGWKTGGQSCGGLCVCLPSSYRRWTAPARSGSSSHSCHPGPQ